MAMNKAITDGLQLMPPPFAAGLGLWSRGDGTPGSPTYQGAPDAAFVPADPDFGGCLELVKTEGTQRLRHMGQTPLLPGMYIRVRVRIKAVAGNLPSVRIAAWAGDAAGQNVAAVPQAGPAVTLASYGEVVTVEAIIGSGNRGGVTLVWGTRPIYAHVGLDLLGPNGGTVRIDDISVEDVTAVFHRQMLDWVDVRDYGAIGDGATDDRAAFLAADAAAAGRGILVPGGTFRIGSNLTLAAPVRFEGRLSMPETAFLALTRSYTIDAYARAFGGDGPGFRRMLQALFQFTDHVALDLAGRRIELAAPVDVAAIAGLQGASYTTRRLITNGQLAADAAGDWAPVSVTSQASYAPANPTQLTAVANVANIPVGALVTGTGVARETYVRSRNIAAGTVELSLPPGATGGTRLYTFTRFRHMLDFSGFGRLDRFEITDLELLCDGAASGIMLAPSGITFRLHGSVINRPRDRAITSIGTGCQGLLIDECQFLSNEQPLRAQDRSSICLNVNANDAKLRDNRVVRFAHFAVVHGSGHMFVGNHFFQGDSENPGVRRAGVIFTGINVLTLMTGNYIDNAFIEMTNEREPDPNWNNQFSFGGLTITGNIFIAIGVVPAFSWIVVTPHGSGHYIQGLSVTGNSFRALGGTIDRVEKVDTTHADLDYGRFRNLVVHGNNFNAVAAPMFNPVTVTHEQNTAATVWSVNAAAALPFGGFARTVQAVVPLAPVETAAPVTLRHDMPQAQVEQGPQRRLVNLRWPVAVRGRATVTVRVDNPV
jgi:hypothetical protein